MYKHKIQPPNTNVTFNKKPVFFLLTKIPSLCNTSYNAPLFWSEHAPVDFFSSALHFSRTACQKTKHYKKVTHCLFDMDGTIIDSESQYHKILKDLCAKRGKKYTKELEQKNLGGTDLQICTRIVEELQLNLTAEQLLKELKLLTARMLPKAPLKKGAEKLLRHLRKSGVSFALATNSTRKDVTLHVATKPHIFKMFHHMVCVGDPDVDRGKPFPDLYLMAAAKFPDKPQPTKCLVFEDSLVGLEAGLAAGMQVVMTPPRSLHKEKCREATLVLESLEEFKPEWFGLPPFRDFEKNSKKKQ